MRNEIDSRIASIDYRSPEYTGDGVQKKPDDAFFIIAKNGLFLPIAIAFGSTQSLPNLSIFAP